MEKKPEDVKVSKKALERVIRQNAQIIKQNKMLIERQKDVAYMLYVVHQEEYNKKQAQIIKYKNELLNTKINEIQKKVQR